MIDVLHVKYRNNNISVLLALRVSSRALLHSSLSTVERLERKRTLLERSRCNCKVGATWRVLREGSERDESLGGKRSSLGLSRLTRKCN